MLCSVHFFHDLKTTLNNIHLSIHHTAAVINNNTSRGNDCSSSSHCFKILGNGGYATKQPVSDALAEWKLPFDQTVEIKRLKAHLTASPYHTFTVSVIFRAWHCFTSQPSKLPQQARYLQRHFRVSLRALILSFRGNTGENHSPRSAGFIFRTLRTFSCFYSPVTNAQTAPRSVLAC